jgi:glycosyltransferase involved in cell wall biosynthesis
MSEKIAVVVPVFNEPSIEVTLGGLYRQEHTSQVHHIIVDNGSTDDTRSKVALFAQEHEDFPLTVIEEVEKGTGAASDTGFRFAIERGYEIVARTDGDTVPRQDWTRRIDEHFARSLNTQLIGGKVEALHDDDYRLGDDLLMSIGAKAIRAAFVLRYGGDLTYLRVVNGANMATRSQAYGQAGGFSRSSIDTVNEDIDYSVAVARMFGASAVRLESNIVVNTSMRRMRHYGRIGTISYYLFPDRRGGQEHIIDVR